MSGLAECLPTQVKLNASPVRRKQKAVPFKKEKGRWGKHCKTEDYRDMVHFSNSRSFLWPAPTRSGMKCARDCFSLGLVFSVDHSSCAQCTFSGLCWPCSLIRGPGLLQPLNVTKPTAAKSPEMRSWRISDKPKAGPLLKKLKLHKTEKE